MTGIDFNSSFTLQSSHQSTVSSPSLSIPNLPEEVWVEIFKTLNLKEVLHVRLVCRHWTHLASDSSTVYGLYLKEVKAIERLGALPARFSAWMPMPRHWGLPTKQNVLRFSSIGDNIISFYPHFFNQSSKFFSFTSSIPFSDRYIFLSQYGDTYFLTPQGQTGLKLELPTDLRPLESHRLVAINSKDPTKSCEFSLLRDLPSSEENLSRCQIEYCFPLSETNIVVITEGGEISFWDLSNGSPKCYKVFQLVPVPKVYRIGNYLILNCKLIDLKNNSLVDHELQFEYERITAFGSSFCAYNLKKKEIRYFTIDDHGVLEQKWMVEISSLSGCIDQRKGSLLNFGVKDMNEKFILLECFQSQAINLIIMNTKGETIHFISEEIPGEELEEFFLYMYPTFARLSDNILIYKNPREFSVSFWHVPTKKHIQKFDWTKSILDLPLSLGDCLVQDFRLSKGKLTLLLSTGHTPVSNKPAKFRLIQFDPQNEHQQGFIGLLNTVKGIYYAFPGRK